MPRCQRVRDGVKKIPFYHIKQLQRSFVRFWLSCKKCLNDARIVEVIDQILRLLIWKEHRCLSTSSNWSQFPSAPSSSSLPPSLSIWVLKSFCFESRSLDVPAFHAFTVIKMWPATETHRFTLFGELFIIVWSFGAYSFTTALKSQHVGPIGKNEAQFSSDFFSSIWWNLS